MAMNPNLVRQRQQTIHDYIGLLWQSQMSQKGIRTVPFVNLRKKDEVWKAWPGKSLNVKVMDN